MQKCRCRRLHLERQKRPIRQTSLRQLLRTQRKRMQMLLAMAMATAMQKQLWRAQAKPENSRCRSQTRKQCCWRLGRRLLLSVKPMHLLACWLAGLLALPEAVELTVAPPLGVRWRPWQCSNSCAG